jgi:hypothetical protein
MSARDRITWLLKWTGTVLTLIGAVLTSIDIQPYNVWLLNIGSAVFVAWAVRIRDGAMITVNLGLLTIYSIGVLIRL